MASREIILFTCIDGKVQEIDSKLGRNKNDHAIERLRRSRMFIGASKRKMAKAPLGAI